MAQPPNKSTAPPVYRPPVPLKTSAPPVYRPNSGAVAPSAKPKAMAPPVYRPVAVQAKFAPGPPVYRPYAARVAQRKTGSASALAEAETVTVASGSSVTFTPLSAGCLAVTVCFSGGGGAALHMAMGHDNSSQWSELLGLTTGKTVTDVYLDGDMQGTKQGWYVKNTVDELFMSTPDISVGPRALLEFKESKAPDDWMWDSGSIVEWFSTRFGVKTDKIHMSNKTTGVSHTC